MSISLARSCRRAHLFGSHTGEGQKVTGDLASTLVHTPECKHRSPSGPTQMPQTRTQTCTDQHNKHRFIAFIESSKRMPKAAVAADDRVDQGSFWRKRRRPL